MTRTELENKLLENKIPQGFYSLDEGLKPDAHILYKNYSMWEYFYLDERGEQHDFKIFKVENESDAFDYIWKKIEYDMAVFKSSQKSKK